MAAVAGTTLDDMTDAYTHTSGIRDKGGVSIEFSDASTHSRIDSTEGLAPIVRTVPLLVRSGLFIND